MTPSEKIIYSAFELFAVKWIDKTSTSEICLNAWYSHAAMFRHFSSKNELCEKMFITSKKSLHKTLEKNWNKNISLEKQLHYLIQETIKYYLAHSEEFEFNYVFWHSRYMTETLKEEANNLCDDIFWLFDECKKENIILNLSNDFLFEMINGMLYSFIRYFLENPNEEFENKIDFIFRSIKKIWE